MKIASYRIFLPLIALFIFTLGNGFFTTFVTVKLHSDNIAPLVIGLMTTAYYTGFAVAAFHIERLILRVGHIRAFAAFASSLSVAILLQSLFYADWYWVSLRFITGFTTAGLFVVIESWLLLIGSVQTRGQVLAFYMIALYAAQALGQFFINLPATTVDYFPFVLVAILASLSVLPLTTLRVENPSFEEPSRLGFMKLYKQSASGMMCCFCAGLILSGIYGLLPLFATQTATLASHVPIIMASVILGGMALQYPIGRASDFIERRLVIMAISVLLILASLFVIVFSFSFLWVTCAVFILGGLAFTLYPVSISLACDQLSHKDIIAGTQSLLLAYSIGASIGPLFASGVMHWLGANGLLVYFIFIALVITLYLGWRRIVRKPVPQEEPFISVVQTTPVAAELDPRMEETEHKA